MSVICAGYLTIILFVEYFILCKDTENFNSCFWDWETFTNAFEFKDLLNLDWGGFLTSFPIFVFGYNCQPNVFPIYLELQRKSSKRMNKVFRRSIYISILLYIIAATFAYLTFIQQTCGNILLNKFYKAPQVIIAAIIFSVSMILATPVFVNAIRQIIYEFMYHNPLQKPKFFIHFIVTFLILAVCTAISITVTDIATVFGFIGLWLCVCFFIFIFIFMFFVLFCFFCFG